MNYKVTLTLIVSLTDKTKQFYDENPADLHEAIATSDNAILKLEPTELERQEDWN